MRNDSKISELVGLFGQTIDPYTPTARFLDARSCAISYEIQADDQTVSELSFS